MRAVLGQILVGQVDVDLVWRGWLLLQFQWFELEERIENSKEKMLSVTITNTLRWLFIKI